MKSAAVELPDPLNPPGDAAPERADDLIAQMAGDEINRLLADAQVEAEPEVAQAPKPTATPEVGGKASANVLDLPAELGDAPVPQETISKELDEVFARQVSATGEEVPTAPSNAPAANQASEQEAADAISADGVTDLLGQLSFGGHEETESSRVTLAAEQSRDDAPGRVALAALPGGADASVAAPGKALKLPSSEPDSTAGSVPQSLTGTEVPTPSA